MLASARPDPDGLLKVDGFSPESFDRILLDPPCSALGLRPKLRISQKSQKDLLSYANYQTRLVEQAVQLLKPGGRLVYSTCTLHARENEGMVRHILDTYGTVMDLVSISIPIGGPGLTGHGLSSPDCAKVRRFDPTETDTMGFFIAAFTKRKEDSRVTSC